MRRLVVIVALLAFVFAISSSVFAQPNPGEATHVVQRGENLYRISLQYGVTMAAIAQRNNIANYNLIFTGQTLYIPAGGTVVPTAVPGSTPVPPPPTTTGTYTVVRGDTLGSIARKFNTTVQALATLNKIANPNLIFAGQVLQIAGGGTVPTPPTPAPGSTPTVPIAGGFELGGHVFSFSYPAQMRGAGMTWAKTQIRWDGTSPASIAQSSIDAARSKGFKILLSIVGNSSQLTANQNGYIQSFANFLGGVAALTPMV